MPPDRPVHLTKIDEILIWSHRFLVSSDECHALREYTPGAGYEHSKTNDLIMNFKKPVDRRHLPEWTHKEQAIKTLAKELRDAINPKWLSTATLVPIPPSKKKTDPDHDDRMLRLLLEMSKGTNLDIRELVVQVASTVATHQKTDQKVPSSIITNYEIDKSLAAPTPRIIGIFDDILSTGSHFRAASTLLRQCFPETSIVGIFLARCP